MKQLFLVLFIIGNTIQFTQKKIKSKRVHRTAPERELFLFGDQKEMLKRQYEAN